MNNDHQNMAPGTAGMRLHHIVTELATWFPHAYNEFGGEPPEVKLLAALADVLTPLLGAPARASGISETHQLILDVVSDLVTNFVYYDRKGDEELTVDALEEAVTKGEISVNEIVAHFRLKLCHAFGTEVLQGRQADAPVLSERDQFEAFYRAKLGVPADAPFPGEALWVSAAWEGWQDRAALATQAGAQ